VDDHILVLDKPAGLLTVAGKAPDLADCLEARAVEDFPSATIIHRLDKDTSGVIVLGLTAAAHAHIGRQFEKRQTDKTYIAKVWGRMAGTCGRVDQPMTADWPNRPKQKIDPIEGRPAITDWQVLDAEAANSRVLLTPHSGRTHQLRVHMSHLGHPILGDNLYAPAAALAASDRLCLHAETLSLYHPDGGTRMSFKSPTPF
jgi:tRNA pseudouridine32 synthase/23S rRNA pseudouridine746 synthase